MAFCQGTELAICTCARTMRPGPRDRYDLIFILAARPERIGHMFLHNLMYHQQNVPSQIDQLWVAYQDFCRYFDRPFDFGPTVRQAQYDLFRANTDPEACIQMLRTSENW